MTRYIIVITAIVLSLSKSYTLTGQKLAESVAAVVGNEIVLLSDIEQTIVQLRAGGSRAPVSQLRCAVFEEAVVQKLFIDQARLDSIEVSPSSVEGELNMRLNTFIANAGSEEVLESYWNKSIFEIRSDLRQMLIDSRMEGEVKAKLVEGISATPSDVRRYFNSLPPDSVPLVPARVELSIIQSDPPANEENKLIARQRILELRSEILGGKSFEVMARLYSEDEASAIQGGEVGFMPRAGLAKEYAEVAFTLKNNTVSRVVETEFGFHIIQLIERRGDMVNTRHILIKPRISPDDVIRATTALDSLATLIRADSISFEETARLVSTHKDSRVNGGKLVKGDRDQRTTVFALEELDKEMYQVVRNLKVGEISRAFRTVDEQNRPVFRIVRLDKEYPAHRANVRDDFELLKNYALAEKYEQREREWIEKKLEVTYIKVSEEFKGCDFRYAKWLK